MGTWSVVTPVAKTNLITNPSYETGVLDWGASGANTRAQSTAQSIWGDWSLLCTYNNSITGLATHPITLTTAQYTFSIYVYIPANWDGGAIYIHFNSFVASVENVASARLTTTEQWTRLEVTETIAADVAGFLFVSTTGAPTPGRFIYIDGAQCELSGTSGMTTYLDGDQHGCEWDLAPHASTSNRSALETRGGLLVDLEDYELIVKDSLGTGMPPVQNIIQRHGQQPGGVFQRQNTLPRYFTLVGGIVGTGRANLHSLRESIIDALKIDRSPTGLPVRLWYDNGTTNLYVDCQYDDGMRGGTTTGTGAERVAIRLVADDPFYYHEGEVSAVLDTRDLVNMRYITARLRATGQWDNLGLTNPPTANGSIYAIKYNPHDGLVYIGGDFTGLNAVAGTDYAAVYNPQTGLWAPLANPATPNDIVWAITIAPNGDVYYGGEFLALGGAAGDYVAYWDISAGIWVPVAANGTGQVRALTFDLEGTLFIGGNYVNWDALGADYCVKYPVGGPYTLMEARQFNSTVDAFAVHPGGDVYIGGSFPNFGAVLTNYWCRYDGTLYNVIDTSLDGAVLALGIDEAGIIFVGGAFSIGGGGPADYIVKWDDQQFIQLGVGVNNAVHSLNVAPDGILYAGGVFTSAGGIPVADRMAKWNGYTWAHLDIDLFGAPIVRAIETCRQDPVVAQNYDLYIGVDTTGNAEIAGAVTITNANGRNAYPERITVTRLLGGANTILEQVRNEMIGRELLFDRHLLDGETLTLKLEPKRRAMSSTMFGPRWDTLPASDVADFYLMPGPNIITAFVPTGGGGGTQPTFLRYRMTEWSVDD